MYDELVPCNPMVVSYQREIGIRTISTHSVLVSPPQGTLERLQVEVPQKKSTKVCLNAMRVKHLESKQPRQRLPAYFLLRHCVPFLALCKLDCKAFNSTK